MHPTRSDKRSSNPGITPDASPLTPGARDEIMSEPGFRESRLSFFVSRHSTDPYERLQPQSRRGCPAPGTGDHRVPEIPERRGGPGRTPALHQGSAHRLREAYTHGRLHGRAGKEVALRLAFLVGLALLLTACGHKPAGANIPAPPPPLAPPPSPAPARDKTVPAKETGQEVPSRPAEAQPLAVETGVASWYGAPYNNRRGSNGEIYAMQALTAAHLPLPLGSMVRVINLRTGHSAVVRITDRGPFVEGRIIDLSMAAAKQVDVWQPGT